MLPVARPFRGYVAGGSGLATELVIPGQSTQPRPTELYATVLPVYARVDNTVQRPVGAWVTLRITWSVQWFRLGATMAALRFLAFTESDIGADEADGAGFRIPNVPLELRQVESVVSGGWEERWRVDIDTLWAYRLDQQPLAIGVSDIILYTDIGEHTIRVREGTP